MGLILFWGAQYSLPEQANLTVILLPKIVGERGRGGHQKFFFGHTQKNFSGHIYNHSKNIPDIPRKNSGHTKYFSTNIRKFCRTYQKIFPNIT